MSFKGKIAIITGGAQGIGKAYTLALLGIGMKVCIVDINETVATEFVRSLFNDYRKDVIFQKSDVTSMTELKNAFDKTFETFGRIDVVVNNAGVIDEHNWKKTIEVNITGVVHGIQLAYRYMGINNGGSGGYIVNTTSKAAFEPSHFCPVYTATKYAVVGLTKSYGCDIVFKRSGIKVCAIGPNVVDTPMFRQLDDEKIFPKEIYYEMKSPLNLMKPEKLGKALVRILEDGKNGALMRVTSSESYYV